MFICVGHDSVVGIATCYGLDGPGIEFWWGQIFRTLSDDLGLAEQPTQWILDLFPTGGLWRDVEHPTHLAPRLKIE
jgi:hypothetical protein